MAVAFGRATPSLRQPPSRCLDNPVPGNIIFSLNGEHHLLLKVLHFRVDKRYVGIHIIIELLSMPSDQIKIPILSRLLIRKFQKVNR